MRKSLLVTTFIVCSLLLVGCEGSADKEQSLADNSAISESSELTFDLANYKTLVSECRAKITDSTLYLGNLGTWEISYWEARNTLGGSNGLTEKTIDNAFEWLEENSDATRVSLSDADNAIRELYKEIILIEVNGNEAEEIDTIFRAMYGSYAPMYVLVTTPASNISSFSTDLSTYVKVIIDSDAQISLFLD